MHSVQVFEQAVQLDAVFPSDEYFIDSQAVHFPLTNLYPALHLVQVSDVGPQAAHPGHVVQEEDPALDHDVVLHALQTDVLPDGE